MAFRATSLFFLMQLITRWRWTVLGAVFALGLISGTNSSAQEVLVGKPMLFADEPSFDRMPVPKRPLTPQFPVEMLSAREIGYVMMILHWDETGTIRAQNTPGTVHPYGVAVERSAGKLQVEPALRAGKKVPVWCCWPVIFNPASSTPTNPDATPRLLEVTPVLVGMDEIGGGKEVLIAPIKLTVNEAGRAERVVVESVPAQRFQREIEAALRLWKFSPARRAGQPVAVEITMPVLVQAAILSQTKKIGKSIPPKPIKMGAPIYPAALAQSGLRGKVAVTMVINDQGRVQDAVVLESNNPGFNEAAIEAVLKWRFEPARIDGRRVNTRVNQLIEFELEGPPGRDAFAVTKARKQGPANEASVSDVLPKPRGTAIPVYPFDLLREKVSGSAKVSVLINESGRVERVLVEEATHPEFGFALRAALETFVFDPALKQGKPVSSAVTMTQKFQFDVAGAILPETVMALADREKKSPGSILTPRELDAPPRAVSQLAPTFPRQLAELVSGNALVEFLIDEFGRACLPRVIEATQLEFGYAATQAVSAWRFEVPLTKGKPAVVRVRVPVEFTYEGEKNSK